MQEVFKFGGASVKNVAAIKDVGSIVKNHIEEQAEVQLVLIISAMGKVTNQLEGIFQAYVGQEDNLLDLWNQLKTEHYEVVSELCQEAGPVIKALNQQFAKVEAVFKLTPVHNQAFLYDQIVSIGEMLSTTLVSGYLNEIGLKNKWLDVKSCVKTNNRYREAIVDWASTEECIQKVFSNIEESIVITQGFLGATPENFTTTLGREGSDYSAAIFSFCLNAKKMTVWKDVPGILNGDPRVVENTVKISQLTYRAANAMTFYGAKVIHPKTMRPLQQKNIPLEVRSFIRPENLGTQISSGFETKIPIPPVIVIKDKQILWQISRFDEQPLTQTDLAEIHKALATHYVIANVDVKTAYHLTIGIDDKSFKNKELQKELSKNYKLSVKTGNFETLTFVYWTNDFVQTQIKDKNILLEQKSKEVWKMLVEA